MRTALAMSLLLKLRLFLLKRLRHEKTGHA